MRGALDGRWIYVPESPLLQQKYLHFLLVGFEGFFSCVTLRYLCALACHSSALGVGLRMDHDQGSGHSPSGNATQ